MAAKKTTVAEAEAAKKVLICNDRDVVSDAANSAKIAGVEVTSMALLLRVLDQMLVKIDDHVS